MVGIDPRLEQLPKKLRESFPDHRTGRAEAIGAFSKEVVRAVAGCVPAVKFQAAFFERFGPEGMKGLWEAATLAKQLGLVVVLDGKRNDIGSTAEAYADAYLGPEGESWDVDALTVNPYLGSDGITPFVDRGVKNGRGIFVLVRTSNPSAGEFQDLRSDGKPIYRHVAERLQEWASPHRESSGYSSVGAVVGATYPEQLQELRAVLPGVWFLVPGYGAQGGAASDIVAAFDATGLGAVVNSSRGIAFAYNRVEYRDRFAGNWTRAVEQAARDMADDLAANTTAGRLRAEIAPHATTHTGREFLFSGGFILRETTSSPAVFLDLTRLVGDLNLAIDRVVRSEFAKVRRVELASGNHEADDFAFELEFLDLDRVFVVKTLACGEFIAGTLHIQHMLVDRAVRVLPAPGPEAFELRRRFLGT